MQEKKTYSKGSKNMSVTLPADVYEPLEALAAKTNTPRNRLIVQAVSDMLKRANKAMNAKTLPIIED